MSTETVKSRLENTLTSPKSAGLAMFAAMLLAFIWVNSSFSSTYEAIHHAPMSFAIGKFSITKPLILWINEGLMVFFFFLVGLEIKREVLEGQLSSLSQIALPAFGAIGGMAAPAMIYLFFNFGDPDAARGWAIPVATDIVLVLALLALLGQRVPVSLKVFLTALAIFDDLAALVIIATFYTEDLSLSSLLLATLGLVTLFIMNRFRIKRITPYALAGVFVWVAVLESGVHATLAGMLIALSVPMKASGKEVLKQVEHDLTPWVTLGVVPVFAFFNAGIDLGGITVKSFLSPISLGVMLGLFVGKQFGVFVGVGLAVVSGIARLPAGVTWLQIYGASTLTVTLPPELPPLWS
tara:strand:+ start:1352 stop:2407 length:1056 start_codon:yes stop_codon:yes gene_type:complete